MAKAPIYDRIGRRYAQRRQPDPRIAAALDQALGDARRVVNVGAGSGSYEPDDRQVVAVEPSEVMITQRPPDAAPVVRAVAEALPFSNGSASATARTTGAASGGRCVIITSDGSTATTCRSSGWYEPEPAPTFTTLRASPRA